MSTGLRTGTNDFGILLGTTEEVTLSSNGLTFNQTGRRILGDFSNTTHSNRLLFQSSTLNGNTLVGSIPNGTATACGFITYGSQDPTNSNFLSVIATPSLTYINSSANGTGVVQPFSLMTGGTDRFSIGIDGKSSIQQLELRAPSSNTATYGPELLTNGTFTGNATGWTLGTGWSYGTNNVVLTLGGTTEGDLSQSVTLNGNTAVDYNYLITFNVTHSIAWNAALTVFLGTNQTQPMTIYGTSTTPISIVIAGPTTPGSYVFKFVVTDYLSSGTITIDDVSIKEIIKLPAQLNRLHTNSLRATEERTNWNGVNQPNMGYGWNNLISVTTAYNTTSFGSAAGRGLTTGIGNSFFGSNAGLYITTGSNNTVVGNGAMLYGGIGGANTAIGDGALQTCSTGYENTAVGRSAGAGIYNGVYNTCVGGYSLSSAVRGIHNVAVGYYSLYSLTIAQSNIAVGSYSGAGITTGNNNTLIGGGAGYANNNANKLTTGTNNIIIGLDSLSSSGTVSNEVTLGNSSNTSYRMYAASWTNVSDMRDKTDFSPLTLGLDFINKLEPKRFTWNMRDGGKVGLQDFGFIAQQVKEVEDTVEDNNWLKLVNTDNPDQWMIGQSKLIPILVNAIKELTARVKELENGR